MGRIKDPDELLTPLIPVSEWRWHRYRVQFLDGENGKVIKTETLVDTTRHVEYSVGERAQKIGGCKWFTWDCMEEDVPGPPEIGRLYGVPLSHDGWNI